ncbi:MAG: molybdopterin cofactor-binding domain-containing protein, partial [Planctomycetota bacterium]
MSLQKRLQHSFDLAKGQLDFEKALVPKSPLLDEIHSSQETTEAQSGGSSRRQFLTQTMAVGGGLALAVSFGQKSVLASGMPAAASVAEETFSPNAFINITADGVVRVIAMHDEMGQGTHTGLAIAVCEELEYDPTQVIVEHAPADVRYNHMAFGVQMTGGSTSMISARDAMRNAGATAREMLISAAAKRWSVNRSKCEAKDGAIINVDSGAKLTYGELVNDASKLNAPAEVALKDSKDFVRLGKPTPRNDSAIKTRGQALFSLDQKVDGMLTAMVQRCPYFGGKLVSFNADKAKQSPGVKAVVEVPSGIAVVADDYWAAMRARRELQIQWAPGESSSIDSDELRTQYHEMAKRKGRVAETVGDCEKSLADNETLDVTYEVPFQAHAPMEPLSCLVTLGADGGAAIVTGSQFLGVDRMQ